MRISLQAAGLLTSVMLVTFSSLAHGQWKYEVRQDEMTDQTTKWAVARSLNKHQFRFPYSGGTFAYLTLRQVGTREPDVMLTVSQGQLLCSNDDCPVLVRFDKEEPLEHGGIPASDQSHTLLFIRAEDLFIESAKKSSTVKIQALFYTEGSRVFEFDIRGLKWPPDPPPSSKKRTR